jgi:hypothetical protein
MDAVIPRIDQSVSMLQRAHGEHFMAWASSVVSDGSTAQEEMSRQGRHLLKAVATLARCDGLSQRSVSFSVVSVDYV